MKLTALHQHRFGVLQLGRKVRPQQPSALVELQAAAATIVTNPQMFPMLGCGKHQKRRLFTSPNRERRRERLLMCARYLSVLAAHADLQTLSAGQRVDGECKAITELQIAAELGIKVDAGDELTHDSRGLRAMRSAARDLEDAELISRRQPKIQYCSAGAGGCGKKIPRGRTCACGRRHAWRWRALPSINTIQKRTFEAFGLRELLEDQQADRYAAAGAGHVGPEPERDIRKERLQRRAARHQAAAAAATGIETHHDPDVVARQLERMERLYGEKKRE